MAEIVTGPSASFAQAFQPQQPDLVGNFARLQQLKYALQNQPLQQQALQQQVQAGQLDLQQRQIALRDQQKMSDVMQQWGQSAPTPSAAGATAQSAAPDYDKLLEMARKAGVSYGTYQGLQSHVLDMKAKAATIAKDDAQTGSANATAMQTKNKMLIDAMTGIANLPDDQLAPGLLSAAQDLSAKGLLDPEHVQMAQQLAQQGDPAAIRKALNIQITGLGGFNKLLEDAQKKLQVQQEQGKSDPNSIFYAPSPAAVAMGTAPKAAEIQAGEVKQKATVAGAEAKARFPYNPTIILNGMAGGGGNPQGLSGDAFLQTLPPGQQTQVKAIANGDIAMPPAGARAPQAQALRNAVMNYDPTYTDARYKGKQTFKTSGDAQNIMQLSTAMEHADKAIQNSAQVGFAPALGNKTFESGASAAYMQDAEFLTGEVGKLVKNGVLTVDEGNKISSGLTSARQSVRDAALKETMDLLGGKSRALFQKYKTATGQDLPVSEFFDAKSQKNLQKYGIIEGTPQGDQAPQSGGGAAPKVGDIKTFPNGKKGRWDGTGWEAQ